MESGIVKSVEPKTGKSGSQYFKVAIQTGNATESYSAFVIPEGLNPGDTVSFEREVNGKYLNAKDILVKTKNPRPTAWENNSKDAKDIYWEKRTEHEVENSQKIKLQSIIKTARDPIELAIELCKLQDKKYPDANAAWLVIDALSTKILDKTIKNAEAFDNFVEARCKPKSVPSAPTEEDV